MALLMSYVLYRSRTPNILRGELQIVREKCERLEEENNQLLDVSHTKDLEIEKLRARTDLSELMEGQANIVRGQTEIVKLLMNSERAMGQLVNTLQAMEKRLDRGLVMR